MTSQEECLKFLFTALKLDEKCFSKLYFARDQWKLFEAANPTRRSCKCSVKRNKAVKCLYKLWLQFDKRAKLDMRLTKEGSLEEKYLNINKFGRRQFEVIISKFDLIREVIQGQIN